MGAATHATIVACATTIALAGGVREGRTAAVCDGMSLREMISVTRFSLLDNDRMAKRSYVEISPDGKFVLTVTQRGDITSNSVEDELLVWKNQAIFNWLRGGSERPKPILELTRRSSNAFNDGLGGPGVINEVTWSQGGRRIRFLARKGDGQEFGLYEVSLIGKVRRLSGPNQYVPYYSSRGGTVIYEATASTRQVRERVAALQNARPYFVGTGRSLWNLLFPVSFFGGGTDRIQLWRIANGVRGRIPLRSVHWDVRDLDEHILSTDLSISPGATELLMDLPVKYVPRRWMQYGRFGIPVWTHVGLVPYGDFDHWIPHQYVIVDMKTGQVRSAVMAPDGPSRGFWGGPPGYSGSRVVGGTPRAWAPDGAAVLLWNTFVPVRPRLSVKSEAWGMRRPCLAVLNVKTSQAECAENLPNHMDGWSLMNARWRRRPPDRLVLTWKVNRALIQVQYCLRHAAARWIVPCTRIPPVPPIQRPQGVRLWVAQSLNSPPKLEVSLSAKGFGAVLFDPNAKLRKRCIGKATTVDLAVRIGSSDRNVKVGLLLPTNYQPGERYPLVIQTHGYQVRQFLSSGFPGPFAARALAASGMAVMQLPECSWRITGYAVTGSPKELPCNVELFRAAIQYAVKRGFADAAKIGIIGFSATCEQVMAALEDPGLHFAAAEVVEGILNSYSQFIDGVGSMHGFSNAFEVNRMGGPPVGAGLSRWIARSAGFSIGRIRTPLLIQANGRAGVLPMWEPYAILRYLGRPVDLIVLQTGTHPVSNPRQQLASKGLGVDWFRYWLEHKRPLSEAEYRRWSELSRVQRAPETHELLKAVPNLKGHTLY